MDRINDLDFQPLQLSDMPRLRPFLMTETSRLCDYTPGCLAMWRREFHISFCLQADVLLLRSADCYFLPLGNTASGLAAITAAARAAGEPLRLCAISAQAQERLSQRWPQAVWQSERSWSDYLYDSVDFCELNGRKHHAQRNHIHRFRKLWPSYSFDEVQPQDLPALREFLQRYAETHHKQERSAIVELAAVDEILQNYAFYDMLGGVLRVDGEIAGFSLGEIIGDTLHVHVEKGDLRFDGVYQMLCNSFARRFAAGTRYINREDDMGDPGLRKSKLSYHPVKLLEKFRAEIPCP